MKRTLMGFLFIFVVAVGVPTIAGAVISTDGQDYSQDYDYERRVKICDQEADGNTAYVLFQPNGADGILRINDGNGAASPCYGSYQYVHIYKHKACENVNNWPDHCGPYVYP